MTIDLVKLSSEFEAERVSINDNIQRLSKAFNNIDKLAESHGDYYSYRQQMLLRRNELYKTNSEFIIRFYKSRKSYLMELKGGKARPGQSYLPKNESEVEMYMKDRFQNEYKYSDLLKHQIEYIVDTLDTLKNMIYGFESAIEYVKLRKNM